MSDFDFTGLTPGQSAVIGRGGWSLASLPNPQPGPRTVAKLIARGLVDAVQINERGPFFVTTYRLRDGVRIAWGAHRQTMRERAKQRGRASAFQLWRTSDLEWGFGPADDITWCGFGADGHDRAIEEAQVCS